MVLIRVTAPAALPVSVLDVKAHTRLANENAEDALLASYIASAARSLDGPEGLLQRALITQTWDLKLDCFPWTWRRSGDKCWRRDPIRLPLPPLQEVVSIKYIDLAGDEQTLAANRYQVTGVGAARLRAEVMPAFGFEWPDTREDTPEAVTIRFTAGYGDAANDVPEPIRHAIMLMVAAMHCDRVGELDQMPGAHALLDPYIVMAL